MNYNKKTIIQALIVAFFIITGAIVFTVFFKPLYYYCVDAFSIDVLTGIDRNVIIENYNILIQYQSMFYFGALELPDFVMSSGGEIHFEEVKNLFIVIQLVCIVTGILAIRFIYKAIKTGEILFLKLASKLSIIIPVVLGGVCMIDFDKAFIIFHKIFFRNDYWIFDATTDPIITILPQDFFMYGFICIVTLILCGSGLCFLVYKRQEKVILTSE